MKQCIFLVISLILSSVGFSTELSLYESVRSMVSDTIVQTEQGLIITIDGKNIRSIDQIHQIFAKAFHFPKWYGKNLDALEELLQDPTYVTEPAQINIVNGAVLRKNLQPMKSNHENPIDVLIDVLSHVVEQQTLHKLPKISFTYSN